MPQPGLIRFSYFGDSSQLKYQQAQALNLIDVGTQPGEVYSMLWPYYYDTIAICYSNNFGESFSVFYQDTNLLSGLGKYIWSRGTFPGELYLAALDGNHSYHIFYSNDYGHTLTLKCITEPIFTDWPAVSFTAGNVPGTCYLMRYHHCMLSYADLWIYYSNDYGASFTTYYHQLDSLLTGIARREIAPQISVYPNPAGNQVTFRIGGALRKDDIQVTIYDLFGKKVDEATIQREISEITMDTRDLDTGVYFYHLTQRGHRQAGKLFVIR
jgi:hypothetical protein